MAYRAMDMYLFQLNKYLDLGHTFDQAEFLAKKATASINQRVIKEQEDRKKSTENQPKNEVPPSTQA